MHIDEMKLLLVDNTTAEFLTALRHYDVHCIDDFGNNILRYFIKLCANSSPSAVVIDWKQIVDALLQAGIGLEEKQANGNGCSPLHLAVLCHLKSIAEYFISLGADTNSTNRRSTPVLVTALMSNDLSTNEWFVDMLLKNGADPNFVFPEGRTVREFALSISNRDFHKFF